jgi:sulfate transport system permease protein
MQMAESAASATALPEARAKKLPQRSPGLPLARLVLGAVVFGYLGLVLLGPIAALIVEAAELGFSPTLAAVGQPEALAALRMSLLLTGIAVVVNGLVGTFAGIALVRHRFLGKGVLSALSDLPLAVSPVMIGLGFLLLVGRQGLFAPLLSRFDWQVVFAFPGLLLGTLFVTLPYTVREVAYVLEELGTSEEEAAVTLGASPVQTFLRVTLPNIRVALGYGLLMTTARSLGEFGAVLVLGGSISGLTQTATTFIHDAVEERKLEAAYGMSLLLGALSVFLLLFVEWAKVRRARALSKGNKP